MLSLIRGNDHVGTMQDPQRVVAEIFGTVPDGTGQRPGAVFQHCGLVHHDAVGDTAGRRETEICRFIIRIFQNTAPEDL